MNLEYVPLLRVQRQLHEIPRDEKVNGAPKRFLRYLRTMLSEDGTGVRLPPLVAINPMAKDHVTAVLDALLELDADGLASRVVVEASELLADAPGELKVTLVVLDDWGAWMHRGSYEFDLRFAHWPSDRPPRWTQHAWASGVLWGSETPTERAVREAMLTMLHRLAYQRRHGPALSLREKLAQEGHVLAMSGCAEPALDADDLEYTREVLAPFLDTVDKPTAIECLFGDLSARSLGLTPRGLSPWAGLALAAHDARRVGRR